MNIEEVVLPEHLAHPNPNIYLDGSYLVLDYETTIEHHGTATHDGNDIVLAAWEKDGKQYYKWGGCYDQGELAAAINSVDFIVAHNAKFELQWLARSGVDIEKLVVFDTMIGEYVIGGNRWMYQDVALAKCAERRGWRGKTDIIGKMFKAKMCSRAIPESWLLPYCLRDVALTRELFEDQISRMVKLNLLPVMFTRCLVTPVLADVECNGMQLDPERIVDKTAELEREYVVCQRQLDELTGGININSPLQLGEYLYDKLKFKELTKFGKPIRSAKDGRRTDQETLGKLKATNKKQRAFLSIYKRNKELYNELTKYLRKFVECCEDDAGMLHASFNQCSTVTHRMSSTGAKYRTQFQNFPRTYKRLFKARKEGWVVGEGDGAQLEFRVGAHLGRDATALSDIRNKVDIHKFTASKLNGCSEEEVTPEQRQAAKADTFKPLYGGQSGTNEQMDYYKAFREKYHGMAGAQRTWIEEAMRTDKLVTEWGLIYYFPNTKLTRTGFVTNSTNICNFPVQAFATAEIIPVALVYFYHYIKAMGLKMLIVNTIHDSIICEIPPDEVEIFHELCRRCLIHLAREYLLTVYNVDFIAPLGCGVKTASHWGEGEEVTYED